ncbi:Y-box-binding protein 2 [Vulpes lagopus]
MVAEAPSGGTEPGSEGERAEDSGQRPRRRHPPPFFYRRLFVRGPRPLNQQQPIEGTDGVEPKETAPLEGDQQQGDERVRLPRFWPRYRRPFRPRPPQQPTKEGGDGETKPSQGPTDGSRPEPQRPRNRRYFQRRRQQQHPGPRQSTAPETSAPINSGNLPPPPPYWSDSNMKDPQSYHLVICQFFQLPSTRPSTPSPFPEFMTSEHRLSPFP